MSISTVISIGKAVVQLLPVIVSVVKTVEESLPVAGAGRQKLEMVRGFLENAFVTAGHFGVTFDQIWPTLQSIVNSTVATFNAVGKFKK